MMEDATHKKLGFPFVKETISKTRVQCDRI